MINCRNLATAGNTLFVLLLSVLLAVSLFPLQAIADEGFFSEDITEEETHISEEGIDFSTEPPAEPNAPEESSATKDSDTIIDSNTFAETLAVPEERITALATSPVNKTMADAFPDKAFRTNVIEKVLNKTTDEISDETIITSEMAGIIAAHQKINVSWLGIYDLSGIEYFTSLSELDCSFNELTELDVSNNTNLLDFRCYFNKLKTLDTSGMTP
ncbi:MAG: hypothetical protein ACOYD7_08945 [Raoultibacter sp.]|jgi:Leucine-rich repeat (LRR) protein